MLSTGEVAGLIQKDEKEVICAEIRPVFGKENKEYSGDPTNAELYQFFINKVRDQLHIVLCFSPVGTKFRERSRKFPALFS